jgi:hypothetical protein
MAFCKTLESVQLEERQQVTVTISEPTIFGEDVAGYFTPEEWAEAVHDNLRLPF